MGRSTTFDNISPRETPRSRAVSESGFSEERASFAASALNSGGYGGLVLGIWTPFWDSIVPSFKVSAKPT